MMMIFILLIIIGSSGIRLLLLPIQHEVGEKTLTCNPSY